MSVICVFMITSKCILYVYNIFRIGKNTSISPEPEPEPELPPYSPNVFEDPYAVTLAPMYYPPDSNTNKYREAMRYTTGKLIRKYFFSNFKLINNYVYQ